MHTPEMKARLEALCRGLRAANPTLFFFANENGIHLRDYKAGRDFLIYSTVITDPKIIVHCGDDKGAYPSFPIPWEGPVKPPPFKVGDRIKDTHTGRVYIATAVTLVDPRICAGEPYWRAAGEVEGNPWESREQAVRFWKAA